ncbi:hypothetical protein DSG27_04450 [Salmonella enterica subsp. enterica]|nr:hypothetical protein [Salmonella enterica subsp. enterica serovar Nima]
MKPGGADTEDKSPAIIIEAWTAGESRKQSVYICVLWTAGESRKQSVYICVLKNELITKIKA